MPRFLTRLAALVVGRGADNGREVEEYIKSSKALVKLTDERQALYRAKLRGYDLRVRRLEEEVGGVNRTT